MANLQALGEASVTFIGRSEPFSYDAGVIEGTTFEGGTTFRVCVAWGKLDYQEFKVKGTDYAEVWPKVKDLVRGAEVKITFRPAAAKRLGEIVGVSVASAVK